MRGTGSDNQGGVDPRTGVPKSLGVKGAAFRTVLSFERGSWTRLLYISATKPGADRDF